MVRCHGYSPGSHQLMKLLLGSGSAACGRQSFTLSAQSSCSAWKCAHCSEGPRGTKACPLRSIHGEKRSKHKPLSLWSEKTILVFVSVANAAQMGLLSLFCSFSSLPPPASSFVWCSVLLPLWQFWTGPSFLDLNCQKSTPVGTTLNWSTPSKQSSTPILEDQVK